MSGLNFDVLRQANAERDVQWDPHSKITLGFRATELGGETGEALNFVKKIWREQLGLRGSRATLEDVASELADVIICADLLAMTAGIDLGKAVVDKFNAVSKKHGLSVTL